MFLEEHRSLVKVSFEAEVALADAVRIGHHAILVDNDFFPAEIAQLKVSGLDFRIFSSDRIANRLCPLGIDLRGFGCCLCSLCSGVDVIGVVDDNGHNDSSLESAGIIFYYPDAGFHQVAYKIGEFETLNFHRRYHLG
jgi:hypothetical protein